VIFFEALSWLQVWNPHDKTFRCKIVSRHPVRIDFSSERLSMNWRSAATVKTASLPLTKYIKTCNDLQQCHVCFNWLFYFVWFACALLIFRWMYLCCQWVPCFSISVHFFFLHCFICGSLSADIACMTNLPCHFQTSSFSVRQQHNTVSNVCTMWF